MIAIVDYGVGNLFSLQCSLNKINVESVVTADIKIIEKANQVILPGVGAFGDAIQKLRDKQLDKELIKLANNGKPLLGICLGMQLLFEKGYEYGCHEGLGLIPGEVCPLADEISKLKIPHMGWNELKFYQSSPIFKYLNDGEYVYFVHSYYAKCRQEYITCVADYGIEVTAGVQNRNIFGTQFHPEKSGNVGLKILKAFSECKE